MLVAAAAAAAAALPLFFFALRVAARRLFLAARGRVGWAPPGHGHGCAELRTRREDLGSPLRLRGPRVGRTWRGSQTLTGQATEQTPAPYPRTRTVRVCIARVLLWPMAW